MATVTSHSTHSISGEGIAVAGTLWLGIHAIMAVGHLDEFSTPLLSLTALFLVILSTVWAARPLLGFPSALSFLCATGLACVPVLACVVVTTTLQPESLAGYGNWWPGAVGPLLASLVFRRHAVAALLAATTSCAAMVMIVLTRFAESDRAAEVAVALVVPPVMWTATALAVRCLLGRTESKIEKFDATCQLAELRLVAACSAERSRREREQRLRNEIVPALTSVARGFSFDDHALRERLRALESELRDDIRGRRLLDGDVRREVARARSDGVLVALVDDYDGAREAADVELARRCVRAALRNLDRGTLSARLPADGSTVLVMAVQATGTTMARVASAVLVIAGPRTEVDAGEEDLLMTIQAIAPSVSITTPQRAVAVAPVAGVPHT